MECIYITDGSLEGLLTAIHEMYYSGDTAFDILREPPIQMNFYTSYKKIKTDNFKAQRVYEAIEDKISERAAEEMTLAWLSELPLIGRQIARYIKMGFNIGYKVDFMLSHKDVMPVHKAASKVRMEVHRMLGLCRFSKTIDNLFLCEITPDHNILSLIAPHFSDRMRDMYWVIHDKSRGLSAVYNQKEWYITPSSIPSSLEYSRDEQEYRNIWKAYFDTIAIEGRINPKLQRAFVPVRYRKNIIEFA